MDLLVVEDNVRTPYVIGGDVKHFDAAILLGLPLELVVVPGLLHPQVGGHYLVLQIDIDQLG